MKNRNKIILITFCLSVLMMSFKKSNNALIYIEVGNLSVVVNAKGAPSDMDLKKLKSVLKGEQQRWQDGTKIKLALMKTTTDIGSDMTTRIYGMTGKELNKYFLAKVFQGKMSSPDFFESESDLLSFVSSKEGAIGIISTTKATGKILNIDGKKSL